jgi:anaerobic selenocysteine-containing dehydrogenase
MSPHVVRTACNRDCPDACGILATVEDGRVVALRGDPDHPVTRGYLCERTSRYLRRQYDPSRLQQPLVRRNGSFTPAGWDEALDLVAEQLARIRRESGPEAVLHYRSGGSLGLLKTVNDYFFECFGGARVKKGDICSGAGEAAQEADMGISDTSELSTLADSRTVFLWGRNLTTSFTHHVPLLKEARSRGAVVVLIDPCPGKTMQFADLVVRPRPGCDRFLGLAIARVLDANGWITPGVTGWSEGLDGFLGVVRSRPVAAWAQLADVEVRCVERLADLLANARPATIQVGWGLGRRRHGGVTVRVLDALGALTGNLGVRGGGVAFTYRRRSAFDTARYTAPPERRGIPEPLLGDGILAAQDPPVRAVVIDNANPVAMLPDSQTVARALETRELVVVLEQFMTDTAERAHVVLPVVTMLEEEDFLGAFGHEHLTASRAVVPPADGTKTDLQIYQALAKRLGFGDRLAGTPREWGVRLLARVADQVDASALQDGVVRNPISPRVLFEGQRFPTPDGRFHFVQEIDCTVPDADPEYPLTVGSFSTPHAQSSQWARPIDGVLEARCHPRALPGLIDGDLVWLESRRAELRVRLRLDPSVRRDLVLVPKGGWLRHGHAANALIAARLTDMGMGAAYYDEPVRIRRE